MSDAFEKLNTNSNQYKTDLGKLEKAAGQDFTKIANGIDNDITKTQSLLDKNEELIKNYEDSFASIGTLIAYIDTLT